ncbi:hypothetical protein [Shinella sp.]|uniref:hypothetical protein n=1 Tax=Shinella sp. TaxID=1870904 RepID=UPI0028A60F67|nr:hypothetical protein [Shinella sp.]
MSKNVARTTNPVHNKRAADESYITQMLRQLAAQARERDVELTYFIEMAMIYSAQLDRKEAAAGLGQTTTAFLS